MTDESRQAAAANAKQARRQAKGAGRSAAKAVKHAATPIVEEVQDTAEKLENTAEEATDVIKRVDIRKLSGGFSNAGQGFLALAAATYAATIAYSKFRQAWDKSYVVGDIDQT